MKLITNIAIAAFAMTAAAGSASAQATYGKAPAKPAAVKAQAKPASVKAHSKPAVHKTLKKTETEADLAREAKISKESATAIALARIPGATVQSAEIEREHGRLIWSFDLKRAGRAGIDEVNVNAITGKVVGKTQHEMPKSEKKEAKQEAKEKK